VEYTTFYFTVSTQDIKLRLCSFINTTTYAHVHNRCQL